MSPPADLDRLSPAELKDLVLKLLAEVAELRRTVAARTPRSPCPRRMRAADAVGDASPGLRVTRHVGIHVDRSGTFPLDWIPTRAKVRLENERGPPEVEVIAKR